MNTHSTSSAATLAIGILTKNEAKHIVECLQSAQFAQELIVIDNGSTDNTVELAQQCGAKVFHYPDWQGFAEQRNRLLRHVQSDYIFFLDADEVITPDLQSSILQIVQKKILCVGKIRWLTVAYGKSLPFVSQGWLERFFPRTHLLGFTGVVHEMAVLQNDTTDPLPRIQLKGKLTHYSRESIRGSLEKLTQYAMLGAAKRAAKGKRGGFWRGMASGVWIFIRLYFFRLGFTGGVAGFLFCYFIALECFFRYVALEIDREQLNHTISRG